MSPVAGGGTFGALPVNPPYDGAIADAYDAWLPPGTRFPDDDVMRTVLRASDGIGLELACGNGRLLVPLVEEGFALEGIDASVDMLDRCRRNARERGLDVTLHTGDIAPLDLDRRFGSLICPAGSFTLIDEDDRARAALRTYHDHLEPGGVLALTLLIPLDDFDANLTWRLRRAGTMRDGTTVVVHEAIRCDTDRQLQYAYNRVECFDGDGRLTDTLLRQHHLRWWTRAQIAERLLEAGFVDVDHLGDDAGWVTTARRRR